MFFHRFGGTEAAIFCCLTSIGKQLQHENLADITLYAKLYHNQRPGIWKDIVINTYKTVESITFIPKSYFFFLGKLFITVSCFGTDVRWKLF